MRKKYHQLLKNKTTCI